VLVEMVVSFEIFMGTENSCCVLTSFKVIINNHSNSPEDNLKYLIVLDNKLSWKPHGQKFENSTIKSSCNSNQT